MNFHYEIEDKKLLGLVEKKALELQTTVDELIWCYVNRGLIDDAFNEDIFSKLHSKEYLLQVDDVLGLK